MIQKVKLCIRDLIYLFCVYILIQYFVKFMLKPMKINELVNKV